MGEVPADWEKAIIVSIHKKKVKLDCNSYRDIPYVYRVTSVRFLNQVFYRGFEKEQMTF